ncbi:putative GPI biosynthesis protein Pig-F [Helianthus annuus]|nr:putative GPI biosynthesis protein Pig-F [Helianthus annuus]
MKKKNKKKSQNFSPSKLLLSHLICGIGLASSFWLATNVFSINLIDYPVQTLCLLLLFQAPVVILVYTFFRKDKKQSSYLKAVARGLLGLPVGAVVNALGAIALGAPVGSRYVLVVLVHVFSKYCNLDTYTMNETYKYICILVGDPRGTVSLILP